MNTSSTKILYIFLFIEILIITLIMKIYGILTYFVYENDTPIYTAIQIIAHDAPILILILFFSYLSYTNLFNTITSILLRLIVVFIFSLYLIDIIILKEFSTHLILEDIIKYISYAPKYILQEFNFDIFLVIILILSLTLIFFFLKMNYKINKIKYHIIFLFFIFINIPLHSLADNGRYVHSWFFKNFIEYNSEVLAQSEEYSNEFKKNISLNEESYCFPNEIKEKNIIILMVESLSSYQSDYFSGIKNWTPNLDKIAKENLSLKNFYSNGFMTEDAEISILTGKFPIYAPKVFSDGGGVSFTGFYNIKDSLPNLLNKKNYQTDLSTLYRTQNI